MSTENKIYEITKMMSDNQIIKGDVNQAADMIRAMINEKYIMPIVNAVDMENEKARKNPGKEVRLLNALKPFVASNSHNSVDKAIDMLHMVETLKGLSAQLPERHIERRGQRYNEGYAGGYNEGQNGGYNERYNEGYVERPAVMAAGMAQGLADASLHSDGVYDIDQRCVKHRAAPGLMPFLAIMMLGFMGQR